MNDKNRPTTDWELFLAEWGCLGCGRKDIAHAQGGFCQACYDRVASQLQSSIQKNER